MKKLLVVLLAVLVSVGLEGAGEASASKKVTVFKSDGNKSSQVSADSIRTNGNGQYVLKVLSSDKTSFFFFEIVPQENPSGAFKIQSKLDDYTLDAFRGLKKYSPETAPVAAPLASGVAAPGVPTTLSSASAPIVASASASPVARQQFFRVLDANGSSIRTPSGFPVTSSEHSLVHDDVTYVRQQDIFEGDARVAVWQQQAGEPAQPAALASQLTSTPKAQTSWTKGAAVGVGAGSLVIVASIIYLLAQSLPNQNRRKAMRVMLDRFFGGSLDKQDPEVEKLIPGLGRDLAIGAGGAVAGLFGVGAGLYARNRAARSGRANGAIEVH